MRKEKPTKRPIIPGHAQLDDANIISVIAHMGSYGDIGAKYITVTYGCGQVRDHIFYGADQEILEAVDLTHDDIRCAHTVLNEDNEVIYQRGVGQNPDEDWSIGA